MIYFGIFILIGAVILFISDMTKSSGFKDIKIYRKSDNINCTVGEPFKITTIIENKRRLPIWFLYLEENFPRYIGELHNNEKNDLGKGYHKTVLSISGRERVKRTYSLVTYKRGVYRLADMKVGLGDVFALATSTNYLKSNCEVVAYPKVKDLSKLVIENSSILGENVVKRWIFQDPLYFRGIREYTHENSMRDIHWKSSLKAQKLMVYQHDFTSDMDVTFILNVQSGEQYYSIIDGDAVERAIDITLSLCKNFEKSGVACGLWSNAQLMGMHRKETSKITTSLNNFNELLEFCARMDYTPFKEASKYLEMNRKEFKKNSTYVFVTPYLDEATCHELLKLKAAGFVVKLIDVSNTGELAPITGIETLRYRGNKNE